MDMLLIFLNLIVIIGLISVTFFLFQINAKLEKMGQTGGTGMPAKKPE